MTRPSAWRHPCTPGGRGMPQGQRQAAPGRRCLQARASSPGSPGLLHAPTTQDSRPGPASRPLLHLPSAIALLFQRHEAWGRLAENGPRKGRHLSPGARTRTGRWILLASPGSAAGLGAPRGRVCGPRSRPASPSHAGDYGQQLSSQEPSCYPPPPRWALSQDPEAALGPPFVRLCPPQPP